MPRRRVSNQFSTPAHKSMFADISVHHRDDRMVIIRTKTGFDRAAVHDGLGTAILDALNASKLNPTEAVVTVRFIDG
jgi:hypothetical protein